ncbi:glutamate racemase [Marinobacter sp. X15-166B]|nr:glutamate racemase [Marinobacter sp. X15-166B]OEY68021.1 glutamate racemase [Marinobacter sp. X15-166B]
MFDSGVGGLSITTCIHDMIPTAGLGYLADNACFPYGDQPEPVVVGRCVQLITAALEVFPADVVVVACNTASTVTLPALRAALRVPVVGVVPAIKPAAAVSGNRRIGLLATPATIRRPYLDQLIAEFAADCTVVRVGHGALVQWIEAWVAGQPLPLDDLARVLAPLARAEVDTVVLGCTHYPLIRETLQSALPGVAHWVDSGAAIARRTVHLLQATAADWPSGEPAMGGAYPLEVALFTGSAPPQIEHYLASIGLPSERLVPHWHGNN